MYGTLCLIDGTYRLLLTIKMALYTILIKNCTGNGRPVAFYMIKDETQEAIQSGLQIFQTVTNKLNLINDTQIIFNTYLYSIILPPFPKFGSPTRLQTNQCHPGIVSRCWGCPMQISLNEGSRYSISCCKIGQR